MITTAKEVGRDREGSMKREDLHVILESFQLIGVNHVKTEAALQVADPAFFGRLAGFPHRNRGSREHSPWSHGRVSVFQMQRGRRREHESPRRSLLDLTPCDRLLSQECGAFHE